MPQGRQRIPRLRGRGGGNESGMRVLHRGDREDSMRRQRRLTGGRVGGGIEQKGGGTEEGKGMKGCSCV